MPDSDDPIIGPLGRRPEDFDEGALLFNPTRPPPIDDSEETDGPDGGRSRVLWMGVTIVVGLLGIIGYQLTSETDATELPVELPPMLAPIPDVDREMIVPVPSSTTQGPIGSTVRVGVRVSRQAGFAWADTIVEFRVESGDGELAETAVRTNDDGIATTSLRLPLRPGPTVVFAAIAGSSIEEGRIVANALPGLPASLEMASGDDQQAEIGQLLPTRLEVIVSDAEGNPVPGAPVRFRVGSGEGMTAPSQTRTDSTGRASALWRLGMEEGAQRLVANSPLLDAEVTFNATATARETIGRGSIAAESRDVTVVPNSYAIGDSHVCSGSGGLVSCRGGNDRGQSAASGMALSAITAGGAHSCGLSGEGVASCWGANDDGQLGDGTRNDRGAPVRVRTELRFSTLTAGSAHTCGLAGAGVPLCWGRNLSGQLGDGTRNDQTQPRTVGGGLSFRSLSAGWSHTCGLTANGNAFCWGLNSQGQLGDGSRLDRLVPTLVRGAVETLVAGSAHTCGISQGQVLCWGENSSGQLGNGSTEASPRPVEVQGIQGTPAVLAAGAVHTCVLTTNGRAFCWGQNLQGQLGDGSTQNRATAVPVAGDLTFSEVHAGGAQTCGKTPDGAEYCWGLNQSGQLGDGSRVSRSIPTPVGG